MLLRVGSHMRRKGACNGKSIFVSFLAYGKCYITLSMLMWRIYNKNLYSPLLWYVLFKFKGISHVILMEMCVR